MMGVYEMIGLVIVGAVILLALLNPGGWFIVATIIVAVLLGKAIKEMVPEMVSNAMSGRWSGSEKARIREDE